MRAGLPDQPRGVNVLEPKRVPGGIQFIIDELDTTRSILGTTDLGIYERMQAAVERVRPRAVPLAIRQAELQAASGPGDPRRLEADGQGVPTDVDLKLRCQPVSRQCPPMPRTCWTRPKRIKLSADAWEREDYAWAWPGAASASACSACSMPSHWDQGFTALTKAADSIILKRPLPSASMPKLPPLPSLLVTPVCVPHGIFFYFTGPPIWTDWIKGRPGYRLAAILFCQETSLIKSHVDSDWVSVSYQLEGVVGKIRSVPRSGRDLRLMSSVKDVSGIPTEGKNLIIVAAVDHVLHFRIFDGDGKMVVDTDEKRLTEQVQQIEDLRKQLESLWPPHELTGSEKGRVITAVTSIVGHTPPSEANAKTGNPKIRSADELSLDNSRSTVSSCYRSAQKPEDLDLMVPFHSSPMAAIRSPSIRVEANNLIRISVLVRRPIRSESGMVEICCDLIGGEQFQFRTSRGDSHVLRVVLFLTCGVRDL